LFEACPVVGQPPCLQIEFLFFDGELLFFDGEPLLFKGDFFGFLSPDGRLVQSLADVLDSLPKDVTNFDVHADCRKSQPAQRERKRKRRAGNGREGNPKGGNKTTAAGQHVPRRDVVPVERRAVVVWMPSGVSRNHRASPLGVSRHALALAVGLAGMFGNSLDGPFERL
jgi:hypothetical protein